MVVAPAMLGCEQKNADPEDGSGGSGTSTGTDPSGQGTTSTSSGTAPTTGASEAPGTSSGTGSGDGAAVCEAFCDRLVACALDGAFDACPCQSALVSGPKCVAAWEATVACFEMASCAELEGESPCWATYAGANDQCYYGEDGCMSYGFGGGGPDACNYQEECLDMPTKTLECDAATCTCTIDDAVVGMCASEGVCQDADLAAERFAACCGG